MSGVRVALLKMMNDDVGAKIDDVGAAA